MRIFHIIFPLVALALFVSLQGNYFANAQEQDNSQLTEQAQELVQLDENINAEDLGVSDDGILPDSRLYFLTNFRRGIQSFFTFNPVKRAELKLQFANEKIVEAKKLADKIADQTTLKKAIENYAQETEQVKKEIDKISDKAQGSAVAEKILDAQMKHHKILGGLMKKYGDIAAEIEQTKQDAVKNFAQSASTVLSNEELQQKLPEIVGRQKGSQFREFKNLEILQEIQDAVPAQAKSAILHAIQESSKNFNTDFSQANESLRNTLKIYMEKTGGNEVRRLEVIDALNSLAGTSQALNDELNYAREKTHEQIEKRFENIQDKDRNRIFIKHLERGDLESIRTLKELENNLSSETLPIILEAKQKSEQYIREKFEQAQSQTDLQGFYKEIEQKPDVRMMSVVKDIANFIPENKQELVKGLEIKTFDETRRQAEEAQTKGRLEEKLRSLSGNDPEDITTLNEFRQKFSTENGVLNQLDKEQAKHIQERFEVLRKTSEKNPQDEDALRKTDSLRLRIEQDSAVEMKIKNLAPSIVQGFKELEYQKEQNVYPKHVQELLQKADNLVQELTLRLDSSEIKDDARQSAKELLQQALENIKKAKLALADGKTGQAFGHANAAVHNANNGLKILDKHSSTNNSGESQTNKEFKQSELNRRTPFQEKSLRKKVERGTENTSTVPPSASTSNTNNR